MRNGDWRYRPDAGLAVMSVVAIVALAIVAAFLPERPLTIAAMMVAALGLTDHVFRPRAATMVPSRRFARNSRKTGA